MKASTCKSILLLVPGVAITCLLLAYATPASTIGSPDLQWGTAVERSESLAAMHLAWVNRNRTHAAETDSGEHVFINRLASFARHVQGTETSGAANALLTRAYSEHTADFGHK